MPGQFSPPRINYYSLRGDRRWERKGYYLIVVATLEVQACCRTLFEARTYINRLRVSLKQKRLGLEAWDVVLWRYEHPSALRPSRKYMACEGKEGFYFRRDWSFPYGEHPDLRGDDDQPPKRRERAQKATGKKRPRKRRSRSKKRHPISGKRLLTPRKSA